MNWLRRKIIYPALVMFAMIIIIDALIFLCSPDKERILSDMILGSTLVFLAISFLEKQSPSVGFTVIDKESKTLPILTNHSDVMAKVYVDLNMKLEGCEIIKYFGPEYIGKKEWWILPKQNIQGVIEVEEMLKTEGTTCKKMEKKYREGTKDIKQVLRIDVEISYYCWMGLLMRYNPIQRWYYDWNVNRWVYEV